MKDTLRIGAVLALLLVPLPSVAQTDLQVGGLADVVLRNTDEDDPTNVTFIGSSNLQTLRMRLFLDARVSDRIQFFTQALFYSYDIFLYSAYVRFQEPGGLPVNLHVGLIPTTVGTYAPRTYSDRNPLVGTPLVYNHHSVLNPGVPQTTIDELLAQRDTRSKNGLPVIYDNCWNTGVEVYGQRGPFDWSLAVLSGSLSSPTREQQKELPQVTGRFAWYRSAGLVVGVNAYWGPYLRNNADVQYLPGKSSKDYDSGGLGYDLYWSSRFVDVHSEVFWTVWEHPTLPDLKATSGYAELRYKFYPRWYVAGRVGFFEPGRVLDGSGELQPWDYPVRRAEYGLGYRPMPRVTAKLVAQHNRFQGNSGLDHDHYLVQLSTAF